MPALNIDNILNACPAEVREIVRSAYLKEVRRASSDADAEGDGFAGRLAKFIDGAQLMINAHWEKNFAPLPPPQLVTDPGLRYVRVWQEDRTIRSAYCFVDMTNGDVLMAASWKKPAKHARSNINDADFGVSGVGPHGANYLNR